MVLWFNSRVNLRELGMIEVTGRPDTSFYTRVNVYAIETTPKHLVQDVGR